MNVQEQDMVRLRHMLGVKPGYPSQFWGYRNHYFAGNAADIESMTRLEQAGLVRRNERAEGYCYNATAAGCEAAGIGPQKGLSCCRQPEIPAI